MTRFGRTALDSSYDMKLSDNKNKVVVKHFSGAKTKDMESYIIPTLEQNPETIIIHSETNDLRSDSSPEEIARDIIKLTTSCKTQTNKVILSSIVPRYVKPEIFV